MRHAKYSDQQVEQARSISLLDYLHSYEPHEIRRISSRYYSMNSHDSIVIDLAKNGKWNRYATGDYGYNAIDYLEKVEGMDFKSIMERLTGERPPAFKPFAPPREADKSFSLPEPNRNNDRAIAYLRGRGIDCDIIASCIRAGTLFESKQYHSCVFVGRDESGNARHGCIRATKGDFKQDIAGSNKNYSFSQPARNASRNLFVFEAPIDLLSHATMTKALKPEIPWDSYYRLSLGGVAPNALQSYLERHPEINKVTLCLDNDEPGQAAARRIGAMLAEKGIDCEIRPPKVGKDYNAYLLEVQKKSKQFQHVAVSQLAH